MLLKDNHVFVGMQRDISPIQQKSEYLYDAHNIRIVTSGTEDTMLSITNERGPKEISTIQGIFLGQCMVENRVVVFTKDLSDSKSPDKIYIIDIVEDGNSANTEVLYEGNLGFDVNNPIDAFSVVEAEDVKKVYWIDGKNISRVMNIENIRYSSNVDNGEVIPNRDTQFDFLTTLDLNETITVEKNFKSGSFPAGTIQYAFSYFNKYRQQSNIFYTTLLEYISFYERGGSPEETVTNSFSITIKNWQKDFDFIRVYAIQRTSQDTTPTCRIVCDIDLSEETGDSINIIDTGEYGSTIDPTELLYLGGLDAIIGTWTTKDNVLFIGNIELKYPDIANLQVGGKSIGEYIEEGVTSFEDINSYKDSYEPVSIVTDFRDSIKQSHKNENLLDTNAKPGFKNREHYRLGIQAQHKNGMWSHPIFVDDFIVNQPAGKLTTEAIGGLNSYITSINNIKIKIDPTIKSTLIKGDYRKIRAVCCYPNISDRLVLAQGVLNPTIKKTLDSNILGVRQSENWSSWFFRYSYLGRGTGNLHTWSDPEFVHGNIPDKEFSLDRDSEMLSKFSVDQSVVTLNSPESEFDDRIGLVKSKDYSLSIVGYIPISGQYMDKLLQTSTPPFSEGKGYNDVFNNYPLATKSWVDSVIASNSSGKVARFKDVSYLVYPWHRTGSLNNDQNTPEGVRTALLKKKVQSRLLMSDDTAFFNSPEKYKIQNYSYAQGEDPSVEFIRDTLHLINGIEAYNVRYRWNIDTVVGGEYHPLIEYSKYSSPGEEGLVAINKIVHSSSVLEDNNSLISVKYKSTPHLILNLNEILPHFSNIEGGSDNKDYEVRPIPIVPFIYCNTEPSKISIDDINNNPVYGETKDRNIGYIGDVDRNSIGQNVSYNKKLLSNSKAGDYVVINVYSGGTYKEYLKKITITNANQDSSDSNYIYFNLENPSGNDNITVKYYHPDNSFPTTAEFTKEDDAGKFTRYWPQGSQEVDLEENNSNIINEEIAVPHLFIGELIREPNPETDFGGQSEFAKRNNLWIPASEAISLGNNDGKFLELELTEGDTWYQRYNCLKTYPFTTEDENQIIELLSFMCETRINLGGIYDKSAVGPHLFLTKEIFNHYNPAYTQADNFFNYRILDQDVYDRQDFHNIISWGKTHLDTSDIDYFTNITLANTILLDGNRGDITKLLNYNNTVYCFQPHSISRVNYNDRTQVTTVEGIPIELANSGKVDGVFVLNNNYGSSNKDAIVSTDVGVVFIDDYRKGLMALGDNGEVKDLSIALNFKNWFLDNDFSKVIRDKNMWISGAKLFDDHIKNDLYIIKSGNENPLEGCLNYSKRLGQFTSFMSYGSTDNLFNLHSNTFTFKSYNGDTTLYKMMSGEYNTYYQGMVYPFDLTYISNDNPTSDKIFTNVETRGNFSNNKFFDYIEVNNSYQRTGTCQVVFPSILSTEHFKFGGTKKKFRIWRTDIPRTLEESSNKRTLDRVRDVWTKIKLGMSKNSEELSAGLKVELYDISTLYHAFDGTK